MTNPFRPRHHLTSIEARLSIPHPVDRLQQVLTVSGRSVTKRTNLWTYHEAFDLELMQEKGYSAADALHHIALVCIQDQPNTLDRLDFALKGGLAWVQGEFDLGQ